MTPTRILLPVALLALAPLPAQQDIEETFADGAIRARYRIDAQGRRSGPYVAYFRNGKPRLRASYAQGKRTGPFQEYWEDGSRKLRTSYRDDQLHGDYREYSADGNRVLTARYRDGQKHGRLTIVAGKQTLTRQQWERGELVQLNGIQPYPRTAAALHAELTRILTPPATIPGADADPLLPDRLAALRRLQAYRYLCGLPYQKLQLHPEWNVLCDYGARLCQAIGRLDHKPPRPPGMDEESYRKGYQGTSHSNLATGSMLRSVDAYMNDSDASNIARIGHRRWCLNPAMLRTGFGQAGRFTAMWSMDASGGGVKGMAAVYYPPPGRVPVDYFGPRHAWSIQVLRGSRPKASDLRIQIVALDADYLPVGKPLELDHVGVTGNCLVFRPVGLRVQPGQRYFCEVSTDQGKSLRFRYLVEFL